MPDNVVRMRTRSHDKLSGCRRMMTGMAAYCQDRHRCLRRPMRQRCQMRCRVSAALCRFFTAFRGRLGNVSEIRIARVYDPAGPDDGSRVLVDRLWPRGLSREDAALDDWVQDVAPSGELRIWFGHAPDRFE